MSVFACAAGAGEKRGAGRARPARLAVSAVALLAVPAAACAEGDASGEADAAASTPAVAVDELAARHGEAVWRVETEGCGWTGVGSAFAIDPTRLVTNHHVIANDTSPQLRSRSGEVLEGRVIGTDRALDIAVIEVQAPLASSLAWAPTPALELQEPLVLIGYPRPAHAFTASFGSLLHFAGHDGQREVLVSDAPVERGSSGGPALRGDGTVAGVVTRAVLDDPTQHVAIVHPAERVIGAVERAIAEPQAVRSDCGLGPDYVPPAPVDLGITETPAPPPTPPAVSVPTTATTVPGSTTMATVPARPAPTWEAPSSSEPLRPPQPTCPSGAVAVSMLAPVVSGEGETRQVSVQGFVANHAPRTVAVEMVEVVFAGSPPVVVRVGAEPSSIDPGAAASWTASAEVTGAGEPPPMPEVRVLARWAAPELASCPSPEVLES